MIRTGVSVIRIGSVQYCSGYGAIQGQFLSWTPELPGDCNCPSITVDTGFEPVASDLRPNPRVIIEDLQSHKNWCVQCKNSLTTKVILDSSRFQTKP